MKDKIESIREKKWDKVCRSVLEYYDKCYDHEKVGKENIKTLDLTDLRYDENIPKLIVKLL